MANLFYTTKTIEPVAEYLAAVLKKQLWNGEQVLWLVSGGSSMAIALEAANKIANMPLYNLTVSLADERFGDPGHPNSNWQQLQAGGFSLPGANLYPILGSGDLEKSTAKFAAFLEENLSQAGFKIGLFGMGADGHTAGILSGSPAINSVSMAIHYKAPDFERITMTPSAIRRLDEAVLYAIGENKKTALENLAEDLPVAKQPAQALKQAGNLIVYNDYKGEKI